MSKALQSLFAIVAVVLTGAAPCFTPIEGVAACPMAHCDRPPANALEAPSCCCAPAGAPVSAPATLVLVEGLALAPQVGPPAPAIAERTTSFNATALSAPPEPVPLYLLHATLLI
jgi:hypothetical protein